MATAATRTQQVESFVLLGDVYTILVPGEQTNNQYTWLEVVMAPGNGTPPHRHRHEDEAFYIIDGRLDLTVENEPFQIPAGAAFHAPRGVVHQIDNNTEQPIRFLVQTTPAAFDRFVRDCGQSAERDTAPRAPTDDEIERVMRLAPEYGIDIITG